jgi:hypothetical protein
MEGEPWELSFTHIDDDSSAFSRFIACLYWSVGMVTSLGDPNALSITTDLQRVRTHVPCATLTLAGRVPSAPPAHRWAPRPLPSGLFPCYVDLAGPTARDATLLTAGMAAYAAAIQVAYILACLSAGIANAYLIGGVVSLLERMNERKSEFYRAMDILNEFLKERGLSSGGFGSARRRRACAAANSALCCVAGDRRVLPCVRALSAAPWFPPDPAVGASCWRAPNRWLHPPRVGAGGMGVQAVCICRTARRSTARSFVNGCAHTTSSSIRRFVISCAPQLPPPPPPGVRITWRGRSASMFGFVTFPHNLEDASALAKLLHVGLRYPMACAYEHGCWQEVVGKNLSSCCTRNGNPGQSRYSFIVHIHSCTWCTG